LRTRRGSADSRLRLSALVGLVVLALTVVVGVQAATSVDGESFTSVSKFQRIKPATISKVAGWKPAWIASNRQATVIVQMAGDPVAKRVADARKQGRELTKAQKDAIRADLKGRQDAIKGRIQSAGGTIVGDYQDAYNGIGVRIALKDAASLSGLPGVTAIRIGHTFRPDNTAGAQYIGAPGAWTSSGKTGTGVKVAVIDTGVDYLHANFGGPGTKAAFDADNHTIIEPGSFPTPKVVGGFDFVGDNFDSDSDDPAQTVPHPDPDPIDCNGHGSHVAGTAAGFGVRSDGTTYTGPYNNTTYTNTFRIGPGVAPQASILAYRVFGCEGSTDEATLVDAIDRAVADGADVINMSLGSPFGRTDEPSTVASDNAADAGVVVVTSAGNSGPNAYMVGAPSVANRAISVAAIDASSPTFPGANITLNTGDVIQAINANNGSPLPGPNTPIMVLRNPDGTVSLGCNPDEYNGATGKIVVTVRGTCARVARAIFGQQHGAVAVIMINTSNAFPPFEGQITSNPDTGEPFTVTIPFLGVKGVLGPAPSDDGDKLITATTAVSTTATTVPNTTYERITSFSSGGPRNVDSNQKPDIAAPGQSVVSTGVGTGNGAATISGTSMAAPMTSGTAALMTQAHPTWPTEWIKGALMNTSKDPVPSLNVRTGGAGVVQIDKAIDSKVVAFTPNGADTVSFGYEALTAAYNETVQLSFRNTGTSSVTYNLSATGAGLGLGITFDPSSVTVPADSTVTADVKASMSAASVAALPGMSTFAAGGAGWGGVLTTRGLIVATPTSSGTGIYTLRVPWLLAPRGVSNVTAGARTAYQHGQGNVWTSSINLTNSGVHAGTVDLYSWGINDANDTSGGEDNYDVRDVGIQELPAEALTGEANASDRALIFAINTYGRWSNATVTEFDIAVDTKGNSNPEFFVVGVDFGAVTTGDFDGRLASFIIDAAGNIVDIWVPDAPMNGSTVLLPALASELGLTTGSSKLNYQVATFPIVPEGVGDITSVGSYRVFEPPVSTGDFFTLNPGQSRTLNLQIDRGKFAGTTVRGWLAVTLDDANGAAQAEEISAEPLP
jgi:minor extracellular serine protease Vpr